MKTVMRTYEFTLIVDGISVNDVQHDELLANGGADDAMLFEQGGTTYVAFYRDAESGRTAVRSALESVRKAYPFAQILDLDLDLVSTVEIAGRLELSKEAVRLYAEGRRRPETPFPRPLSVVSNGQRVWQWSDVFEWAEAVGIEAATEDEGRPLSAQDSAMARAEILTNGGARPCRASTAHMHLGIRARIDSKVQAPIPSSRAHITPADRTGAYVLRASEARRKVEPSVI